MRKMNPELSDAHGKLYSCALFCTPSEDNLAVSERPLRVKR